MRTGYVYKQQELYKTRIETTQNRIDTAASQADKNKFKHDLKKLREQFDEIHLYEEKIHILSLDCGGIQCVHPISSILVRMFSPRYALSAMITDLFTGVFSSNSIATEELCTFPPESTTCKG